MSNNLDPDQARCFVGPDLGPNCLQMLSADDTRRQRVKQYFMYGDWHLVYGVRENKMFRLNCYLLCTVV